MSLPWPERTREQWVDVLAKQKRKKTDLRVLYREDQARDEGGKFAPEGGGAEGGGATAAPILTGVNSTANAAREVEKHLANWEQITGERPTPEKLKAAEAELRALPLVHGTTVAGALGAADEGLRSFAGMQVAREKLDTAMSDIRDELADALGAQEVANAIAIHEEDPGYAVEAIQDRFELDRDEATELVDKLRELDGISRVLEGKTNVPDQLLGLDQFVFMTHGQKHQDYGDVAVIIDNAMLDQRGSFATEHDIVMTPDALPDLTGMEATGKEPYAEQGVKNYKGTIVKGDDYYKVAAAKAGSPDSLAHRSREQLFEVKAPRVPKDAVKGFMVENDLDTAQRLADKLASKGQTHKVLYVDEPYSATTRVFVQAQMKHMQTYGSWDDDALETFREEHDGVGVYIL